MLDFFSSFFVIWFYFNPTILKELSVCQSLNPDHTCGSAVAQWKSAWLETERPRVRASPAPLRCGPLARHINPSLVLVQPRKTRPCLTERLLMGRKESNQTNKKNKRPYLTFCPAWPRGHRTFSMLTSAEHEIYPAHKCLNANSCWHFNIYKHDKYNIWETWSKKLLHLLVF